MNRFTLNVRGVSLGATLTGGAFWLLGMISIFCFSGTGNAVLVGLILICSGTILIYLGAIIKILLDMSSSMLEEFLNRRY